MFRRADGLGSNAVQSLFADSDGSLWIGTADNGLSRFKGGRFAHVDMTQGLVDNAIGFILDDGLGHFWLSTHHGIQRIAKDELNRCADGTILTLSSQIYAGSDGLPTSEFTSGFQTAGCKTPDGRLWFATSKGPVSVDPRRVQSNRTPPPVVIESLLVDGALKSIAAGAAPMQLAPGHRRLEFQFCGLSYVDPAKVRFRYRVDGIDQDWIEAGSKRSAFYSRLPAGAYRFRVLACNNDGVWNTAGASLAFTVAPFFWETWWFLGIGAILAIALVTIVARYFTRRRMQRRIEQLQRENALQRERTRIAQDIHDDVGSSLTKIAMLSQPAQKQLATPERAAAVLSGIFSTAQDATRSLDETVWAIDPKHDTLDGLVGYMGKFAQDFLASANIRCRLDLPTPGDPWPVTAETRHNLFLAFKEALNNALKHAAATEVRISLVLRPDAFVLVITDNGRGFDVNQNASAHPDRLAPGNGLANLKRRLEHIGGRCDISSRIGEGTSVSFTVYISGPALGSPTSADRHFSP
jgi:signal transduction histidine kinase